MKFSILVPVYNAEKYLEDCLNCVFNQTHKDFEIIFVDDGSTDKSAQMLDDFEREHKDIVRVFHQQNQGQLATRQKAISKAQGDYCIFMDVDDKIAQNALEILDETINAYASPDMIIYSFMYEYSNGNIKRAAKLCEDNIIFDNSNKKDLLQKFFETTLLNNVWTKCVKTEVLKSIDFDFSPYEKLRCAEDRLHSMVMMDNCNTVCYIYEPLYRYKLVDGSVTRSFAVDTISKFNTIIMYEAQLQFIRKWGFDEFYVQKLNAQYVKEALYILDLYYNNVSKKDRDAVLYYDWSSFLNKEIISSIDTNKELNETQKNLWDWIESKNYKALKFHFLKKKIRKALKKIKG